MLFECTGISCLLLCCSGPPGAGLLRGDDPAPFAIWADQQANSCGEGALGAGERLEFAVELSTLPGQLFWDGRAVSQVVEEQFEFQLDLAVPLAQATTGDEICRVLRSDTIAGRERRQQGMLVGVSGTIGYRFSISDANACTQDVARQAGLQRLPCQMKYEMEGQRSKD